MKRSRGPEMRYHPLYEKWVILAPGRNRRPSDQKDKKLLLTGECPFCPGNESATPPEIATVPARGADKRGPWRIRVVPNKYPALEPGPPAKGPDMGGEKGLFIRREGTGIHEVIVETPVHSADLAVLDPDHVADILRTWASRIRAAYDVPGLAYALIFKNHRSRAGASLSHSHSQLIATSVVPTSVHQKGEASKAYFSRTGRCLVCSLLEGEQGSGSRIIHDGGDLIVLTPYASRFPYEIMIVPKLHNWDFTTIAEKDVLQLAVKLKDILGRLKGLLNDPPFNLVLHTAPNVRSLPAEGSENHPEVFTHWHIEIMPRLSEAAGFEWGGGFHINTVSPEEAARKLRGYDMA